MIAAATPLGNEERLIVSGMSDHVASLHGSVPASSYLLGGSLTEQKPVVIGHKAFRCPQTKGQDVVKGLTS